MEPFTEQLSSCGVSVTAQRLAVLQAVSVHPHSTADSIIEAGDSPTTLTVQ